MVDVARSIVDRHLLGLDDEILAYISDMVQGDESEREMTEDERREAEYLALEEAFMIEMGLREAPTAKEE